MPNEVQMSLQTLAPAREEDFLFSLFLSLSLLFFLFLSLPFLLFFLLNDYQSKENKQYF